MKRKNATRNALFTSIISLLLCVSMLVGTTFAWFTDEVASGMNTIAAGNLDLEVTNEAGDSIQDLDKLFDKVDLWEPGVVAYENLTVKNVGTLALKYNLNINFANENTVNGYGLSDVLKVAIVDEKITESNRNDLIDAEARQTAGKDPLEWTLLSGMNEVGALLPGDSDEFGIVIWWEPSNEDNNWNVNNGKEVSDFTETGVNQLHIDLGVNVFATQQTHEEDSFDNRYDGEAFVPVAQVTTTGPKTIPLVHEVNGASELALENSFSFKTTEDETAAAASGYRYWHADFVVSADNDIKAKSVALAGYYDAYAQATNTVGKWIALVSDQDVTAGTEIRLMEYMGVTGNYEELCNWIPEFLCGVKDLDGSNRGTTLTVELRLYETTIYSGATSGSANIETGEYKTIGVYEHTFGGQWETLEDNTVLFIDNEGDVILYDTQDVEGTDYVVPEGVTHIGNYAFSYTDNIETVTLASTVTDLGRGFDSNSTIKKVVLNEGLETIASRAFKATSALEEVVISSTVTTIADDAFQKTGLKEIVIPDTVEYVGAQAFGASAIETVTFKGNTTIQNKAFRGCASLRTVNLLGDDITFENTTGQANCWFCNSESNNPNTSNITFNVQNEAVAAKVKTAMGAEANNIPVYVNGVLYEG